MFSPFVCVWFSYPFRRCVTLWSCPNAWLKSGPMTAIPRFAADFGMPGSKMPSQRFPDLRVESQSVKGVKSRNARRFMAQHSLL